MIRFLLAAAATAAVALAASACGSTDASLDCSTAGATATVSGTGSLTFSPVSVTIAAGQSVCWQNTSGLSHTVTADGGSFTSPLNPNVTFTHTFATAGAFPYHCTIHAGMVGTVTVN